MWTLTAYTSSGLRVTKILHNGTRTLDKLFFDDDIELPVFVLVEITAGSIRIKIPDGYCDACVLEEDRCDPLFSGGKLLNSGEFYVFSSNFRFRLGTSVSISVCLSPPIDNDSVTDKASEVGTVIGDVEADNKTVEADTPKEELRVDAVVEDLQNGSNEDTIPYGCHQGDTEDNTIIQQVPSVVVIKNVRKAEKERRKAKRVKTNEEHIPSPKSKTVDFSNVLVTGVEISSQERKQLKNLEFFIEEDFKSKKEIHAILATGIKRTTKFLLAVCKGIPILSLKKILEKNEHAKREISKNMEFFLFDEEGERKYSFSLQEAIEKGTINFQRNSRIFEGKRFLIDEKGVCQPATPEDLKILVEAMGGSVEFVKRRKLSSEDFDFVISNCMQKDKSISNVFSQELIIEAALTQKLDCEKHRIYK